MDFFELEKIICRTCLNNDCGEYTNLNHGIEEDADLKEDAPNILDCLHFCLHYESPTKISLTQYICKKCLSKLKSCYEFIKMAKQSETKLRSQQMVSENIETNLDKAVSIEIEYINADEELLLEDEHTRDFQLHVIDDTCGINCEQIDVDEMNEAENEIDEGEEEMEINVQKHIKNTEAASNGSTYDINKLSNGSKNMRFLPHQCEQCSFATNSIFNLRRHHIAKQKIYPTTQQLKRKEPVNIETSEKTVLRLSSNAPNLHECEMCKKVFRTDYLLKCHINKHKGLNPYKCQICNYESRYISNISRHYKLKHAVVATPEMLKPITVEQPVGKDFEFDCAKCMFLDATNEELNAHLTQEHDISIQSRLEVQNSILSEAIPYDPYIYMCSKCSKKFKMLHVLKTHELTCRTETSSNGSKANLPNKPYVCSECSSRFAIPEYLQTHRAVVHRARVHPCHICDKSFKLPSQLKNHIARHTASRTYKCDQCARSYVSQSELNVHRRVHTGELPYSCNICSQRFRNADRLAVHRNKNHLHAKFKCSNCSEEFESKAKLQLHRYKHTSMPYNCEVCLKEFDKRHHIRRHMASVHHTKITDEQLAAMFARNMKRNNRYDVFQLGIRKTRPVNANSMDQLAETETVL